MVFNASKIMSIEIGDPKEEIVPARSPVLIHCLRQFGRADLNDTPGGSIARLFHCHGRPDVACFGGAVMPLEQKDNSLWD